MVLVGNKVRYCFLFGTRTLILKVVFGIQLNN